MLVALLIDAAASIGTLLLVVVGALEMRAGALTLGTLAAFIGSVGYLYSPIRGLGRTAARFQRAAAGAQRVATLLDAPSLVQERPGARPLPRPRGLGRVPGRDLRLPARPGRPAWDRPARRGGRDRGAGRAQRWRQVVAGPAAAAALRPPRRVPSLIDGHDLRDLTLHSLRRAVAVVFQDAHLLRASVGANIAYGCPDADEAR